MNYFKLIILSFLFVILHGCATSGHLGSASQRSDFHQAALMGNPDEVRRLLPTVINIDAYDSSGFAAIHWASTTVTGQPAETLKVLLQAGANPNLPQKSAKMTPLFFASSTEVVNILVDAGADVNYKAIDQSTPLFHAKSDNALKALLARGADKNAVNMTGDTAKEHFEKMIPFFEKNPGLETVIEDYKRKIAILGGNTPANALQANSFTQGPAPSETTAYTLPNIDSLLAAQPCPMSDTSWIYTGELCTEGAAHGKGSAVHQNSPLRFEGLIESGLPVEGVLFENDIETYEGTFKEGLAHGVGVCYFEGAPEECRYFKGQRIDTLHKQRVEFERQQNLVMQQSKKVQPVVQRQTVQQPVQTNTIGDAIEDELFEQGAKFLFNQLF